MQITHFVLSNFSRKSRRLWDNVEKYGRAGQATDDALAHAHCTLDTHSTQSEYEILIAFPLNNYCRNAPQYYVIHIFPVSVLITFLYIHVGYELRLFLAVLLLQWRVHYGSFVIHWYEFVLRARCASVRAGGGIYVYLITHLINWVRII